MKITHIDVNSALTGKAFVGDTIIALDNMPIKNSDEIHMKLKEPTEVHNVDYSSIAGVHLRPGDVIREVNDKPVASKTMLKYYITEGAVKEGRIHFLVECPSGEAYRDSCDMAPDVTEIALQQVIDC
ncbi:hypothetical protein ANCDUO_05124 [Ancylostoma duodenale]|uniref:PDZ domain-containing protein n=1 Tax=Ancylostoma duodenale TaxID=51022 RepID=A0A0C2GTG0_9BILA|nr:hypothetical protein ANCDUO_05124 [Ancylostoma duodenale]